MKTKTLRAIQCPSRFRCVSRASFDRKLLSQLSHPNGRIQNMILWYEHSLAVSKERLHKVQVRRDPPARVAGLCLFGWSVVDDDIDEEMLALVELFKSPLDVDDPMVSSARGTNFSVINLMLRLWSWRLRRRNLLMVRFNFLVASSTSFVDCSL